MFTCISTCGNALFLAGQTSFPAQRHARRAHSHLRAQPIRPSARLRGQPAQLHPHRRRKQPLRPGVRGRHQPLHAGPGHAGHRHGAGRRGRRRQSPAISRSHDQHARRQSAGRFHADRRAHHRRPRLARRHRGKSSMSSSAALTPTTTRPCSTRNFLRSSAQPSNTSTASWSPWDSATTSPPSPSPTLAAPSPRTATAPITDGEAITSSSAERCRARTCTEPYPIVGTDQANDVGEGRLIPTTAVEQYAGTLAQWFGLSDSQIREVFPNFGNFGSSPYLGFMSA